MVFVEVVVVIVVSIEAAEVVVAVVKVALVLVQVVLVVGRGGRGGVQRKGVGVVVLVFGVLVDMVFPIEPGFVASRWALRGRGQNGRIPVESAIAHAATAAQGGTGRVVGRKTVHPVVVVDARNSNTSRVKTKAKVEGRGSRIFCSSPPHAPLGPSGSVITHTLVAEGFGWGPGALRDMGSVPGSRLQRSRSHMDPILGPPGPVPASAPTPPAGNAATVPEKTWCLSAR